jgi:hypothetical protein
MGERNLKVYEYNIAFDVDFDASQMSFDKEHMTLTVELTK